MGTKEETLAEAAALLRRADEMISALREIIEKQRQAIEQLQSKLIQGPN